MQSWHLEFGNSLYPYLFGFGVLLIAFSWLYYRKTTPELPFIFRALLFTLRILSIAIVIFLLSSPTIVLTEEKLMGNKLAVLIDKSASMGFMERGKTRLQSVSDAVDLQKISKEQPIIPFAFSDTLVELNSLSVPTADSNLTALGNALRKLNTLERLMDIGGILIISDGRSNLGSDPLYEALRMDIPISAIGVGDTIPIPDLSIEDIDGPNIVYRSEKINFKVFLKSDLQKDLSVFLDLYQGKTLLKSKKILLSGRGATKPTSIGVKADSVGEFNYRFVVRSSFKERFTKNNSRSKVVRILKDRLNILLSADYPSWEFTFLKRVLASNDKYNVSVYLPGKGSKNILTPQTGEKLGDYDCLIFLSGGNKSFNRYGKALSDLYSAGKLNALIFLSPETANSRYVNFLREIGIISQKQNPFAENGEFLPKITNKTVIDALLRLPYNDNMSRYSKLPPLKYRLIPLTPNKNWDVVMSSSTFEGDNSPLLLKSKSGGNHIVIFNGGPIWRWKFFTNRTGEADSTYKIMMGNIITWLTVSGQANPIEVTTDKKLYELGDEVRFKARVLDDNYKPFKGSSVIVELKNGNVKQQLNLERGIQGKFEGLAGRLAPGGYSYIAYAIVSGDTLKTVKGHFTIEQFSEEFRHLTADRHILKRMASSTGGRYLDIENKINGPFPLHKNSIVEKKPIRLSAYPSIMIPLILLLALEWIIRKRRQLP